ncbi:MAG: hypothetical protein J0L66_03220 [Cytophagales bacterium]|nr:hypothetical protein [Cytophagales bacterium]
MLLAFAANAQLISSKDLTERFVQYQEAALQEKLFVHTSKNDFLVGETIYFSIYSVDGMLHQPLTLSRVAFLELIDSGNKPIVQTKVALQDAFGNGSLAIPDTLRTGYYRLVAYTSWMRNFDVEYYFKKQITVVNPQNIPVTENSKRDSTTISFYPEGGYLVADHECNVAFKVSNNSKGVRIKGRIVNQLNDTIARFEPLKFGIGTLLFKPQPNQHYKAFIRVDKVWKEVKLPTIHQKGSTIRLFAVADSVKARITQTINSESDSIILFVHSRGKILDRSWVKLNAGGVARLSWPVTRFEDGINHITIFDKYGTPAAERLYFKKPMNLALINAEITNPNISVREASEIKLKVQDASGYPLKGKFSLSLFKTDNFQKYDSINIINYLMLTSDLRGTIENPAYYLSNSDSTSSRALDNLMLTHGWRRFVWTDVINHQLQPMPFSPDTEGMTIRAIVHDETNKPIPNSKVLLSTASPHNQLYASISNFRGIASFYTKNLVGQNELFLQELGYDKNISFTVLSPFTEKYPQNPGWILNVDSSDKGLIRDYSIHAQATSLFFKPKFTQPKLQDFAQYGKPDKTYRTNQYVEFPLVKDALSEYVSDVIVRKQEAVTKIFLFDKLREEYFENEPLVLIDGIPVLNTDRIVGLQAGLFEGIEVYNRKVFYGPFVFNGVLSLKSKTGKFNGIQINPEATVLEYEGLQLKREFYVPGDQESELVEEKLPDFRNPLLWVPNIQTNSRGEARIIFTTSDLKGTYLTFINGISENGLPGTTAFSFQVK